MAGDWLKVDVTLPDKPEVWQIAGITGIDPDAVVGKLLKVWRWFDAQTEDGNAHGVTYALVDHVSGVTGFGEAMALCGWLEQNDRTLTLPNFERHNGKTAKNRALTAKRVAACKAKGNGEGNGASVSGALPREEKRREEKKEQKNSRLDFGDCSEEVIADFKKLRKAKKAELTQTALAGIKREASKAGMSLQSALETCCLRGWTGFKAEWVSGGGDEPKPKARRAL